MPEVMIAGGGPSGLAAAIALAERDVPVTVTDAKSAVSAHRAELLPHGAAAILERLGLTDVLDTAVTIKDVVSDWGKAGLQSHGAHPGLGLHGWGIDRRDLSHALLRRARRLGVQVLSARITSHVRSDTQWQIGLTDPAGTTSLTASYVIDATGRPAVIARKHGATVLRGSDLIGLTWRAAEKGAPRMLAEAAPDGWWYSVPDATAGTFGFMTSPEQAKRISRAPGAFLNAARDTIRLITLDTADPTPVAMDSCRSVLVRMSGTGWLATGDAASGFDPIASQGLFNALSGGFFAGQAAADALAGDSDAPRVYAALAARTAERTFAMTHLQYAALPFDTDFWRSRGRADPGQMPHNSAEATG